MSWIEAQILRGLSVADIWTRSRRRSNYSYVVEIASYGRPCYVSRDPTICDAVRKSGLASSEYAATLWCRGMKLHSHRPRDAFTQWCVRAHKLKLL